MATRRAEVIYVGDAQSLIRASRQAATATEHSGKRQEQVHLRLRKSFAGMTGSVTKMAGGFVAAYASIEAGKKAIDTTEELAHATIGLHRNLGLTVEQASRWAAVARARGIDSKQLNQAFGTLSKNAVAVAASSDKQEKALGKLGTTQKDVQKRAALLAKGLGPQADAFKKLGLSASDVQGANRNFEGFLHKVSDGLNRMGSGTERTALGMKLFGKGWQTVIPVLRGGSKAMDEQLKLADKYGVTFKGKTVKSLEEFIMAQRESKFATMGLQVAFGTMLAPALTKGITAVNGFVKGLRDGTGEGGKFAAMLKPLTDGLKKIFDDKNLTLGEKISKAFQFAAPMIADAAGKAFAYAAPRAVTAFIRAFKDAGPWGEFITVAFLLHKLGAFSAAGSWAAGQFVNASKKGLGRLKGVFVAAGAEAGAAGGLAEGEAAAGASGLRSAKVISAMKGAGRFLGGTVFVGALALGIGAALPSLTADVLRKFKELVDPGSTKTPDMGDVLGTAPGSKGEADKLKNDYWKSHPPLNPQATGRPRAHASMFRAAGVRAMTAVAPMLPPVFPLDASLAKLQAQRDALQARFDTLDKSRDRAGLVQAIRDARLGSTSGGGGVSLGGGGSAAMRGGAPAAKGKYGKSDLMRLWVAAGGDPKKSNLMAAIALAESGGQAGIVNSIGATGLWQIHPGGAQYKNPMTNAKTAVMKLRTQGLAAWEAYTNGSYRRFIGGDARASKAGAHGVGGVESIQQKIDRLNAEKRGLPSGKAGAGRRKSITDELAGLHVNLRDAKASAKKDSSVAQAVQALKDFDREAGRAKKLAAIDLKIKGIEQVKAFKDAVVGIKDQLHSLAQQAADAFRKMREQQINQAHDAAYAVVDSSAQAQELASLQATDAAEQDAKTQEQLNTDLANAKASGDVKAIKDAEDAIAAYKRQKREQELADWIAAEKQKADAAQATQLSGLDQETADYQAALDDRLSRLTVNLGDSANSYAAFVKNVQGILSPLGLSFTGSAGDEATVNGGSGVFAKGVSLNPNFELVRDSSGNITGIQRKGHAAGGYLGTVGELGPEDLYGMPNGRVKVMPASQSSGGGGGPLVHIENYNAYGSRSGERLAHTLAFRLRFAR